MGSLIQSTLNGLKERLRLGNGKLILQSEGGEVGEVICEFNESTNQENILSFEKNTGWKLPDDYKDFLLLHNGANIFDDPEYGGGLELYRLEEIKNIHEEMEFPNHWCPIGYYQNVTGYVCIDTMQANGRKSNYLLFVDLIELDDPTRLNSNFEIWLDRFVVSQGGVFWEWPIYTAKNYYRD